MKKIHIKLYYLEKHSRKGNKHALCCVGVMCLFVSSIISQSRVVRKVYSNLIFFDSKTKTFDCDLMPHFSFSADCCNFHG